MPTDPKNIEFTKEWCMKAALNETDLDITVVPPISKPPGPNGYKYLGSFNNSSLVFDVYTYVECLFYKTLTMDGWLALNIDYLMNGEPAGLGDLEIDLKKFYLNFLTTPKPHMPYSTPHVKSDPGTEDHIDCAYCCAGVINEVLTKELGYLVGKAMKELKGKANPCMIAELIKNRIK